MVFKQIFRVAFVALIWKQYKALIISSCLLIAFLLLVSNVHDDYLTHSQLQSDKTVSTGLSFVYKWIAYAIGLGAYFIFHFLRGLKPTKQNLEEKAKEANIVAKTDEQDPFAAIRNKKKLRSRADFLDGKE